MRRRNLLQSDWYREYWSGIQLSADVNLKNEYTSTHTGAMYSTWIGGATGRGADFLVIDDPHALGASATELQADVNYVRSALFSRLDQPAKGAIVVIMQRLHEGDLTGELLNPSEAGEAAMKERLAEDAVTAPPKPDYSMFTKDLQVIPPWWRR